MEKKDSGLSNFVEQTFKFSERIITFENIYSSFKEVLNDAYSNN